MIVANEDGSGATTIYTSTVMLSGHLAPNGFVYFWEGGVFKKIPATGGAVTPLFDTGGTFSRQSDLSPDGSTVAWYSIQGGMLFLYHIATGTQTPLAPSTTVAGVTFDRTGGNVIYLDEIGPGESEVRIVPVSGGASASLGLTGRFMGIDAAHTDSTLAIAVNPAGGFPYIGLWEPGMSGLVKLVDGYSPTYRCDDSAIIYDRMTSSGAALYRRSSAGAITMVAKPEAVFPKYKQVC
ncbi:MAG: hypothetical protein ACLGHC_07075 [Alphaproteobacteria bacterium]